MERATCDLHQSRSTDTFYRLFGDINGDGVVNASDNFQFKKDLVVTYTGFAPTI